MREKVEMAETAFAGLWCRVNGTAIDLATATFETNEYLTGGRIVSEAQERAGAWRSLMVMVVMSLCLALPLMRR